MTTRTRLGVVLALVCLLSLSVLASSRKVSRATGAMQIAVADVLYDHGQYRSAMRTYLAATACEDAEMRDRARKGTVRAALKIAEFGVAITQMTALDGTRAGDPATLALAGDALWAAGRFDEAEQAYRDAASLDPAYPRARQGIAKALASKNKLEEALDQIEAAVGAAPDDPEFLHTKGTIYERLHRFGDAAAAFQTFLLRAKGGDDPERTRWGREHIAFLRSFDGTVPYQTIWNDNATRQVLDFRLVKGKVMIKARVNGRKTVEFALDTGAEHTVLSEKTARKLNVPILSETLTAGVGMVGVRGLRLGRIESLEIGGLTVYDIPCLVKSPSMASVPVDVTDGFSPMSLGLSVSVDYKNRKLVLGELLPDNRPAQELPLRFTRLATVQGAVNGNPWSFIVDTGGEAISLSASTARGLFTPDDRHRIKLNVWGASGLDPDAYLLPGVDLAFGPVTLQKQSVIVLNLRAPSVLLGYDIGGIIGYRLLGRYHVEFDLKRSVLRLGEQL